MIWRSIPGWSRYEVSDTGLVRSRDMAVGVRNAPGGAVAIRKGRVLSQAKASNGYLVVTITDGRSRQQAAVHRLVALAFCNAPPHKSAHVLHADGDKTNNTAANLRWGTPADNHADTERHGRRRKGDRHPQAKLTEDAVRDIRKSTAKAAQIAAQHGITREHVWAIRCGRVWSHVS